MKKVVDAEGLAKHFKKSKNTIYRWANIPGFPYTKKPGMPMMFHIDEVENFFRANRAA